MINWNNGKKKGVKTAAAAEKKLLMCLGQQRAEHVQRGDPLRSVDTTHTRVLNVYVHWSSVRV